MNKKALVITALVVGSSSVAMADSGFRFRAGASASFSTGTSYSRAPAPVVVRDHRTSRPYYEPRVERPVMEDVRWHNEPRPVQQAEGSIECRNWDPTLDASSSCGSYSRSRFVPEPYVFAGWDLLGSRESAVPGNQFLTINDGRAFSALRLTALQGRPQITKVAIRFMDGSTQVTPVYGNMSRRGSVELAVDARRAINQIVVYTAAGSHGAYSIAAL